MGNLLKVGDVVEVLGNESQYLSYNEWKELTPELRSNYAEWEEAKKGEICVVRVVAPHNAVNELILCAIQNMHTNKVYIFGNEEKLGNLKLVKAAPKHEFKVGDVVKYVKPIDRRSGLVNHLNGFIIGETYVVSNVDEYLDGALGIEDSRYFLLKDEVELVETAKEEKKEILDDVEKEYLGNIIKPKAIHDKIVFIEKRSISNNYAYIDIDLGEEIIALPMFNKKTMYKGMIKNRKYTLGELGL